MKLISFITLICFIITNVAGNIFAGVSSYSSYNENFDIGAFVNNKDTLPAQYGQITEAVYKPGAPLVMIINDLHKNPAVQTNIEQMIGFIRDNFSLKNLIIEGAPYEKIKKNIFSSIPLQARQSVADEMMKRAAISGAESFVIKNDFDDFFGLEQWDIYIGNIQNADNLKDKYSHDIGVLRDTFSKNKILFPKSNLFSLLSYENSSDERVFKIGEFCKKNKIDISVYTDLNNFINMRKYDGDKNADVEFISLLEDLKGKVPYNIYSRMVDLLRRQRNGTNMILLFETIKRYCPEILVKYETLVKYFNAAEARVSIRSYNLLRQMDVLENRILEQFSGPEEREFLAVDKFIYLLQEYTNLSLTYEQYNYLRENKDYLYAISYKYLNMRSMTVVNNILNDALLDEYYSVNIKRNAVFCDNLRQLLKLHKSRAYKDNPDKTENIKSIFAELKKKKPVNIVVVGGFHGQFTDMLKESEVSILSVIPNTEGVNSNKEITFRYRQIVYNNALAPPSVFVQANIGTVAMIIKSWLQAMQKLNAADDTKKEIISEWLGKNNIKMSFDFNRHGVPLLNGTDINVLTREETKKEDVKNQNGKFLNFLWALNNIKIKNYLIYLNIKAFFKIANGKIGQVFNKISSSQDISNITTECLSRKLLDERIINNEYQRTLDCLNKEMPDIVIITVDGIDDIAFCDNILEDIKKHPNFAGTRLKYIIKDGKGTGKSFTQALEYLRDISETAPEIPAGKKKQDLRTVIIDIDGGSRDIIGSRDLPLQFNGRNIIPLELALLNGIRSFHGFKKSGGISVIDPRNIYIGNMAPAGDITFVSSAVNMTEVQNQRVSLVIKDYPDKLEQIYYGFNPEKITDIVERKGIEHKSFYNFDNGKIRQFEVITGNILIKFDDDSGYSDFFGFMSEIADYLKQTGSGIDIMQHIFVPFIRTNHNAKTQSYFAKTREKNESVDERKFFLGLADLFNRSPENAFDAFIGKVKFGIYHQSKSFYSRNFSKQTFDRLSSIIKAKQKPFKYTKKSSDIKKIKQINIAQEFNGDTALARAYKLMSGISSKRLNSSSDYEQVYDALMEIIRITTFKRQLYTTDNVDTAKLYKYMSDFISNAVASINEGMTADNGEIELAYLENLKIMFLSVQNYVIEYIRLLDYTSNMSTLGGYVYPKNSFFEKYKLMPFNRYVFGFTKGIKKAENDIKKQVTTVYSLGNFLIGSLYSFPVLKNDIESFIEEFENPKQRTSVGMQKQWGNRRAIQRFLSLTIALQSFATSTLTNLITPTTSNSFMMQTALIALITGLGLSVFLHRISIWAGWRNVFYNKKKKEIEKELAENVNIQRSMKIFSYNGQLFLKLEILFTKLLQDKTLGKENKELLKNNIRMLKRYGEDYDLRFVNIILKNSEQILPFVNNEEMKSELNQFIEYLQK